MEEIFIDIRKESEQIKRIFKNKDLVSVEELLSKIEDLDDDVSRLENEYKELENDLYDNYRPIPVKEQVE